MALSDSPMAQMMYRNALLNLSNGAVSEIDKTVLSSATLPDEFIKPYLSEETDALTVMNLSYNSLSTWIEEAKKANYFSKHFVTLSRMIMSGVATMARGLVTLHARGEDLSQAPMSIQDLIGVGSYHIRKSYIGVLQTSRKNPEIGERLLLNQLSWTNTMMRLFKTREKLQTESSKCKVQSANEKKIDAPSNSELPVGNDVEAFEPFESSEGALEGASALSAPGAYTVPRAYASFGSNTHRTKKKTAALPEANTSLPEAHDNFDGDEAPALNPGSQARSLQSSQAAQQKCTHDAAPDSGQTQTGFDTEITDDTVELKKQEVEDKLQKSSKEVSTPEIISHTVEQNTEPSKETESDDADASQSEQERSRENETHEFSPYASPCSVQQEFSQREDTGKLPVLDPDHPPEYFKILYRALKRSEGSEDGSITFMENEIYQLLADPVFCYLESALAEDLKKAIDDL